MAIKMAEVLTKKPECGRTLKRLRLHRALERTFCTHVSFFELLCKRREPRLPLTRHADRLYKPFDSPLPFKSSSSFECAHLRRMLIKLSSA